MPDRPDPPEQKLYIRMAQAEQQGKEFDEARERKVLGLPIPEAREMLYIPPSTERQRIAEREDTEGRRQLERDLERRKAELATEAQSSDINDLRQQLAALEERNRKLEEEMGARATGVTEAPAPGSDVESHPGPPDSTWHRMSMISWAKSRDVNVPQGGIGMTDAAILNYILDELAGRDEPDAEPAPEETAANG